MRRVRREFANRVVKDVSPKLIVGDRGLLASIEGDVPRLLFSEVNAQLPATPMFAVSDAVNGETPFQIVFTSGTTAEPKGIVLTHRNVLASLKPSRPRFQVPEVRAVGASAEVSAQPCR